VTLKIDNYVQSTNPNFQTESKATPTPQESQAAKDKRTARREECEARWKKISEAGGIDSWINEQLKAKGLYVDLDPTKLTDKQRKGFKEKKKAEAEERRNLKKLSWEAYFATHISHLGSGVFWNDETDADKFDIDSREERARQNDLPELKTPEALAKALGMPLSKLRGLTYHRDVNTTTHYRTWTIPKRNGNPRTITAPKRDLKKAQRWILRNIAEKLPVHNAAHGFLAEHSIVSNAVVHAGADVLVKVDIKDFFPTITWRRVKGLLRKAGLNEQIATLMALLSTEAPREQVQFRQKTLYVAAGPRALPQGAPTSPAITNAICLRLDRRMSALSKALGFTYTRYADDLAFSWYAPEKKAKISAGAPIGALLRGVNQIVRTEGFIVNRDKTQVLRKGDRQKLTGLVVNDAPGAPKARVPRETIRQVKAALFNREHGKPGKEGESLAQLKGMASFIFMTDPIKGRAFLDRVTALEAKEAK
jgi:RNA-directed DNA polymerase